jgi:hypothetical protein
MHAIKIPNLCIFSNKINKGKTDAQVVKLMRKMKNVAPCHQGTTKY